MLRLSEFNYFLPKKLIASKPHEPRDECRFLVYDRKTRQIKHARFDKILNFLNPGDVLVLNDTEVIPARLIGRLIGKKFDNTSILPSMEVNAKKHLGRKFKILLIKKILHQTSPFQKGGGGKGDLWEVLIDGKKRNVGIKMTFGECHSRATLRVVSRREKSGNPEKELIGEIVDYKGKGIWEMKFNKSGKEFQNLISKIGKMPLPPYIKQTENLSRENKKWYQTVYAKYAGSVAAPTAGLHFTKKLLKKLKQKGVQLEYVTLHVGLGTFMPVKTKNIAQHKMHPEYIEITPRTAKNLNQAKKENRRIIAVGTTTTRALESAAKNGKIKPLEGEINIFIYPPYKFKFIDALVTNFHLPKSTLLMLVSALIGQNLSPKKSTETVKKIYSEAINKKYHFYSYGDAMFVY